MTAAGQTLALGRRNQQGIIVPKTDPVGQALLVLEVTAFRQLSSPGKAPLEATVRLLRGWLRERGSLLKGAWLWRVAGESLLSPQAIPAGAEAPEVRYRAVVDAATSGPVTALTRSAGRGNLQAALRFGDEVVGAFAVAWSGSTTPAEVGAALVAVLAPWPALLARESSSLAAGAAEQGGTQRQVWQGVSEIIGHAGGLRDVIERVQQVARTDAPVLLLGETGSGKEVVARAVHALSQRRAGPVLRVNCGAIPSELVDSELFGHEKGSFTGAVDTRKGWFERASGGTLFLDEVAELPPAAQVRLLRVLQDGSYERVGGGKTLQADVRIVAATHRDLADLVRSGQFRQDLWYRIAIFPIHLPPLRERMEDLPELARRFAESAGERVGVRRLSPTDQDLHLLRQYDWPGNVRELAAVIERAAILGHGKTLQIQSALALSLPNTGVHAPAAQVGTRV